MEAMAARVKASIMAVWILHEIIQNAVIITFDDRYIFRGCKAS